MPDASSGGLLTLTGTDVAAFALSALFKEKINAFSLRLKQISWVHT